MKIRIEPPEGIHEAVVQAVDPKDGVPMASPIIVPPGTGLDLEVSDQRSYLIGTRVRQAGDMPATISNSKGRKASK